MKFIVNFWSTWLVSAKDCILDVNSLLLFILFLEQETLLSLNAEIESRSEWIGFPPLPPSKEKSQLADLKENIKPILGEITKKRVSWNTSSNPVNPVSLL